MSSLFGTLNLGARALQTHSQGLAVAGQNLANVNNSAYTRQRLIVQTSVTQESPIGPQGTGVTGVAIERIQNAILDRQIQTETSVTGFWNAQQASLASTQTELGELVDSKTQTTGGTSASAGVGAQSTLASDLSGLFTEFQTLAATPASLSQRAILLNHATKLATQFNLTDRRLADLNTSLNQSVGNDVDKANQLLQSIADLNHQIRRSELAGGAANDLRDLRQQRIQDLSTLTNLKTSEDASGTLTVAIGSEVLVSGSQLVANLQTFDPGNGQLKIQTSSGTALALTGGSLQGTIDARDGSLATLRKDLNSLAQNLITEVNTVHRAGFNLAGGTGADFFNGTDASSIQVNPALVQDPSLLQASGSAAAGDNQTARAIAKLADQTFPALGGLTFSGAYNRSVTAIGTALANANSQVDDQQLVHSTLVSRRASISGVSIDEEMTDLVKYQKAFQASARIVSVVDSLLDEVIHLK